MRYIMYSLISKPYIINIWVNQEIIKDWLRIKIGQLNMFDIKNWIWERASEDELLHLYKLIEKHI